MALEVFSGSSVTLPALSGTAVHSEVDVVTIPSGGIYLPIGLDFSSIVGDGFTQINADFSKQTASSTFTEVNVGGSGDTVPKVGIIFPRGVPVFCA